MLLKVIFLFLGAIAQADSPGYVQFISSDQLKPMLARLPKVSDPEIQRVLKSSDTMWYDARFMRPVYQDSVTPVLGIRANTLGIKIAVEGDRIFNNIGFHFPFKQAVGLDQTINTQGLTFWSPPRNAKTLPVALWKDDTTRWRWMFPKDTIFGEVFYLLGPKSETYAFEIRTRKRTLDGWESNIFRPFVSATALSAAIRAHRPDWMTRPSLKTLVEHLENTDSLQVTTLESFYFSKTFEPVKGALDILPSFDDDTLVAELLTTTVFQSSKGKTWKRSITAETYAASTHASFSIVPANYQGGLMPVNDSFCNRCHEQTGRQIGEFNFNTVLYGEIWGEDRIFSWHLFDESGNFDGAYHENRILNKKLKAAGLIENYSAQVHTAQTYKVLPRPFKIYWH